MTKEETNTILKKTVIVETVSKKNTSIKTSDAWYNFDNSVADDFKNAAQIIIDDVGKGDKIVLTGDLDNFKFSVIEIKEKSKTNDSEGWHNKIIPFGTLLSKAHKAGLLNIETEMITVDWDKKTALFKATVKGIHTYSKDKLIHQIFTAYGDATQDNIDSDKVKKHWIRMAETRAIARALRFYTDSGECSDVETEDAIPEEEVK